MENISFKNLVDNIKVESILDVGCGGLGGENTTNYLLELFGAEKIQGVCKDKAVLDYATEHKLNIDIKIYDPKEYGTYDLVVLDPGIEYNLEWWKNLSTENVGKYCAAYIMCTDEYGDENTYKTIRETWEEVWGGFPTLERIKNKDYSPYTLVNVVTETRRPEITWILLEL